ncbi:MAG TPA: hypothetical protein DDW24_08485 [Blastocatellia bacterium]|nr:DUF5615 family PIN-like protein [Chloracidobacterium sp.]HBE82800.1 hypothetical protein [Blastocatellia bacterium]
MKVLIDMNLSPDWTAAFTAAGIESVHWSTFGDPRAEDTEIVDFARSNGFVVFTHDLDFGTILALTYAIGPSVIQVRTQNVIPSDLSSTIISVIREHEVALEQGALIVVDESRARVRILPLG